MFFSNTAIVIRAKRNSLELYLPPNNQLYKLEIPQNLLHLQEVVNENNFVKYVLDFLIKINNKSANVSLVLDSQIVFEKTIIKIDDVSDKNAIDSFFFNVPLDQNELATKIYSSENQYFLYATNRTYYNLIVKACIKIGWSVNYVTPLSVFRFNNQNQPLNNESLQSIRNGKPLARKINFLEEN